MMLFRLLWFSAVLFLSLPATAQFRLSEVTPGKSWEISVDKIPASLGEFQALRDSMAVTPQGGIVTYLLAQLILISDPVLGEQCLILSLDSSRLYKPGQPSRPQVEGWGLGSSELQMMSSSGYIRDKGYAAWSYVQGTSPEKGYVLPPLPYHYFIQLHSFPDPDPLVWKGMVRTSCQTSGSVPLHVKKNSKGIWKVINSSSYYSGCIDPPVIQEDEL